MKSRMCYAVDNTLKGKRSPWAWQEGSDSILLITISPIGFLTLFGIFQYHLEQNKKKCAKKIGQRRWHW